MSIDFNEFASVEDDQEQARSTRGFSLGQVQKAELNNQGQSRKDKFLEISDPDFFDAQRNTQPQLFLTRGTTKHGVIFECDLERTNDHVLTRWQFGASDWALINVFDFQAIHPDHHSLYLDFGTDKYRNYEGLKGYTLQDHPQYLSVEASPRLLTDRLNAATLSPADDIAVDYDGTTEQGSNSSIDPADIVLPDLTSHTPEYSSITIDVSDGTSYTVGRLIAVTATDAVEQYLLGRITGIAANTLTVAVHSSTLIETKTSWTVIQAKGLLTEEADSIHFLSSSGFPNPSSGILTIHGDFQLGDVVLYSGKDPIVRASKSGYQTIQIGYVSREINTAFKLGVGHYDFITYHFANDDGKPLNLFEALDTAVNQNWAPNPEPREIIDRAITEEWESEPNPIQLLDQIINQEWP